MSEKTKIQLLEEIIGESNNAIIGTYVSRRDSNLTIKGEVVNAMQAYADQEKRREAIAFARWVERQYEPQRFFAGNDSWKPKGGVTNTKDFRTLDQLYDLFLQSLTQHT